MTNNICRTISIPDGIYDLVKAYAYKNGNISWSKAASLLLSKGLAAENGKELKA